MSVAAITDPTLVALLDYWQMKRGNRTMPERRDIDPLEMGSYLLPHLVLCDLFDRGTRVRFRLVGTVVVKRLGADPTGKYLDAAVSGAYLEVAAALHRLVYCQRAPIYSESLFTWGTGRRLEARHLLLPLTQGGPEPAIALGGFAFHAAEPFPPTLRALAAKGAHEELRRLTPNLPVPREWVAAGGRNVA